MKKTLIISGGEIDLEFLRKFLNNTFDIIIAVDRGLQALNTIKVKPSYIIGDFDSVDKEILDEYKNTNIEVINLNPEKDYSDTHMALKLAIKQESKEIYIVGALGKRVDHALANIHILKEAIDCNVECKILDNNNEIQLINKYTKLKKDLSYKYISLIPLTTEVTGITLTGFKYPLENATLNIGHSIGISNEQIDDMTTIDIKKGILILIKSRDSR